MTAGGFPHSEILGSKPCRRLPEAYRGPTRPSSVLSAKASTTTPSPTTRTHIVGSNSSEQLGQHITTTNQSSSDHKTTERTPKTKKGIGSSIEINNKNHRNQSEDRPPRLARVHYPVLKPPPHDTTQAPRTQAGDPRHAGDGPAARGDETPPGGGPGTQKHAHTTPPPAHRRKPTISSTPATPTRDRRLRPMGAHHGRPNRRPENSVERR